MEFKDSKLSIEPEKIKRNKRATQVVNEFPDKKGA